MFSRHTWLLALLIATVMSSCKNETTPVAIAINNAEITVTPEVSVTAKRIKRPFIAIPERCPKDRYVYVSWNLENFGKSKSPDIIELMADILREADIVAGQEVSVGDAGAQATTSLADALNRKGKKWDSIVSDRTEPASSGVERYVYFWSTSKALIKRRDAHLVKDLEESIEREPYRTDFHLKDGVFSAFSIHAVPTAKNPIQEVRALAKSGELGESVNTILSGDFNLSGQDTDPVLTPVGFVSHIDERTSLKQKIGKKGEYLLYQYDNIYTKGNIGVCASGTIDFPTVFYSPLDNESLKEARLVSDHLPVYIVFYFKKGN